MRDTVVLALVRAELCRVYAEKQPRSGSRRTGRILPALWRKAWRRGAARKAASAVE